MAHNLTQQYSKANGVPAWITSDIIQAESGGNPSAVGDNGTSFGLLQLHQNGGQGTGYTQAQLFNPATNLQIGVPPIAQAYKQSSKAGLTGLPLLLATANSSGHPGNLGTAWTNTNEPTYNQNLTSIFNGGTGAIGSTAGSTAGSAAGSALPTHLLEYALLGVAGILLLGAVL